MRAELSVRMKPKSVEAKKKPQKAEPPQTGKVSEPKPEPPSVKGSAAVFYEFPEIPPAEHPQQTASVPAAPRTYRALDTVRGERDAMLARLQYPPHQKNAH